MSGNPVGSLVDFLLRSDETEARASLAALEKVGVAPTREGLPTDRDHAQASAVAPSPERDLALISLAQRALTRAIAGFDQILSLVQRRIRRASMLRLLSAIVTTILSSSVVASLQLDKSGTWGVILGVGAVLASILTLVATRLEGGDAKLAEGFADISIKYAQAQGLLDRLQAYTANPTAFDDLDKRLAEADTIVQSLYEWRAKVGIT
jgi:hypothetical protein